jgi:hypothetical protein
MEALNLQSKLSLLAEMKKLESELHGMRLQYFAFEDRGEMEQWKKVCSKLVKRINQIRKSLGRPLMEWRPR